MTVCKTLKEKKNLKDRGHCWNSVVLTFCRISLWSCLWWIVCSQVQIILIYSDRFFMRWVFPRGLKMLQIVLLAIMTTWQIAQLPGSQQCITPSILWLQWHIKNELLQYSIIITNITPTKHWLKCSLCFIWIFRKTKKNTIKRCQL